MVVLWNKTSAVITAGEKFCPPSYKTSRSPIFILKRLLCSWSGFVEVGEAGIAVMLCGVSLRFNVLCPEVLCSVIGKRNPENRELL
jgi:hypothetical protein